MGGAVSHLKKNADKGGRGVGIFLILADKGERVAKIICEQPNDTNRQS